jgi:coatomer protein complex subunit epsilon
VLGELEKLVQQHGQENLTVQLIAGIVYDRVGETEKALSVLSKHQGSLDAYAHLF